MSRFKTTISDITNIDADWYKPDHGFFGDFYVRGDDSLVGFLKGQPLDLEQRTVREVDGVLGLFETIAGRKLREDDKILDVPCGYGRHAAELSRRGFDVSGADINPRMIELAKLAAPRAHFYECELVDLPFEDGQFNLLTNMFFSFGFYPTDQENEKAFSEMSRCVADGGVLIVHSDTNQEAVLAGQYEQPTVRPLPGGFQLYVAEDYLAGSKRLIGSWRIKGPDVDEKHFYSMRLYSREEYAELAFRNGFTSVEFFGDVSRPSSRHSLVSPEIIVVAKK